MINMVDKIILKKLIESITKGVFILYLFKKAWENNDISNKRNKNPWKIIICKIESINDDNSIIIMFIKSNKRRVNLFFIFLNYLS